MHFLEAIDKAWKDNQHIQRDCWSPSYYIYSVSSGYLDYEDSFGNPYHFTEDDVYADDWYIKEDTYSFSEALKYLGKEGYKIKRASWRWDEWEAFCNIDGSLVRYKAMGNPYETVANGNSLRLLLSLEDILAEDWIVYDRGWNPVNYRQKAE